MVKTGSLSIHTENIFPIIKKFLYSNQEVFLRELVSNAVDATQKLRTLASVGEFKGELGDVSIEILIDKEQKTLTVRDRGVGLTSDEVEKYINQIAFSGAEEFLTKYKDTANAIIGHFGLGFYSAFMVANVVEIKTKSWQDAPAVHWYCEGRTEFTIQETEKLERGTDIILHLNDDAEEFLENYRVSEVLNRYCKFLPVPLKFEEKLINETEPIWNKKPADLTDENYLEFYRKLYPMSEAPMFWIHLNVDYPFNLTGVLYFPKLKPNMDFQKNKIQLYSNQVFITDNVEDIVPDYLTLLHGVIDSPDIPLNVSRSYLQTDIHVRKINSHIAKKVADKLHNLFTDDREEFNKKWENIGVFVKYGMLRDNNFNDRVKDLFMLENVNKEHFTLEEYKNKVGLIQKNKDDRMVYLYSNDLTTQDIYIQAAQKRGYDVLRFDGVLDQHFITFLEQQLENTELMRVDADSLDKLIDKGVANVSPFNEEEEKSLIELFNGVVKNPLAKVETDTLGHDETPLLITKPEHQRRMMEMTSSQFAGMGSIPDIFTCKINTMHPLSKKILETTDLETKEKMAKQVYDLSLLAQGMLKGAELTAFLERNYESLAK